MQNSDHCCPLSARESNFKYQINSEMIELLSNKIQKIKQSIKETSDKGANSISSIFKKKKIPPSNKKILPLGIKKGEDFIEKKSQNSKTRNKKNKNGLVGTTSSNSNLGINEFNNINNDLKMIEHKKFLKKKKKEKIKQKTSIKSNILNSKQMLISLEGNNHGIKEEKNKVLKMINKFKKENLLRRISLQEIPFQKFYLKTSIQTSDNHSNNRTSLSNLKLSRRKTFFNKRIGRSDKKRII